MEVSRHHSRSRKRSPQLVQSWKQEENQFFFYCPETILLVTICDAHILRFRFCPEGWFEDDFSYALPEEKVEVPDHLNFELQEVDGQYHLITSKLTCKITKSLHISIFNANGVLISEDERGFHWERHPTLGGNIVYSSKKIQEQENFYGLGDKPERFNLRGLRFENWGSDTYGFEKTSDPLYKNIPFFMGLHHGLGYGIFFDNSFRTRFDFGHERSDVCSFWSKGGEMNYYFIYGPNLINVVEGYAQITGKPEMPPMWALGYHQSKWSYYPEETVKSIGKELREYQIPCDALHIDIDYMDGFRCFTWDHTRFPDPRRMIAEMENEGFKTVVILDPGIKIDREYFAYKEGIENGYFCRRADGPLMQGNVWPGMCHFPDFTSPEVREWWAGLFEEFMKSGVHGVWNDMNEPALIDDGTFPQDTRHAYDGHYCSHRKAHNVYGMQMSRATYHGLKKNSFPRRPFALTRSTYAGGQRYAAVWTGDNLASW
ncbi:MAG: TIM-barrel domain-containing protein, partial [Bacteroidota bacterium]